MLAAAIRGAERHRFTPERARFSGGDLIILAIDEVLGADLLPLVATSGAPSNPASTLAPTNDRDHFFNFTSRTTPSNEHGTKLANASILRQRFPDRQTLIANS